MVVALLQADGKEAVKAAVAAGKGLTEPQRYSVLQVLRRCRTLAEEDYGAAVRFVDERLSAWVAAWGDKRPVPPPWVDIPAGPAVVRFA